MAIDLFDFYKRCLLPLTPHPAVTKILKYVMSGGETTDDFAEVLHFDPELQHWARVTVQRMGKGATKIEQVITLLGQDRIRDMVLGRYIERAFVKAEKSLVAQAASEAKSATPSDDAGEKGATKPGGTLRHAAKNSEDKKASKGDAKEAVESPIHTLAPELPAPAGTADAASEIIPDVMGYKNYLSFAIRAENVATEIRNSYPGQAFAGGVLFDYVREFLQSLPDVQKLSDERLKNIPQYVGNIFEDGLRCGIAANSLMSKIVIRHQKTIFVTALCHNIGKALLLAYDPLKFESAFVKSTGSDAAHRIDSTDAEEEVFDFDHAQAGSLFFRRLSFFEDIEMSIDFHHHPHLLRFSDPNLFALTCALRLSGALVKIYEKNRARNPKIDMIPDARLKLTEDFKFLKLSEKDWGSVKADYYQKLIKAGL